MLTHWKFFVRSVVLLVAIGMLTSPRAGAVQIAAKSVTVFRADLTGAGIQVGLGWDGGPTESFIALTDGQGRHIKAYPVNFSIGSIGSGSMLSAGGEFRLQEFRGKTIRELFGYYFGMRSRVGVLAGISNGYFKNFSNGVSMREVSFGGLVLGLEMSAGVLSLTPKPSDCSRDRRQRSRSIRDEDLASGFISCSWGDRVTEIQQ